MNNNESIAGLVGISGGLIIGLVAYAVDTNKINKIPSASKVQQGFIAPSRLEIKCDDLDQNGEKETVLTIRPDPLVISHLNPSKEVEGSYMLRIVDGKPVLSPYEVKGPEIIYK